jgi:hypothetical protein
MTLDHPAMIACDRSHGRSPYRIRDRHSPSCTRTNLPLILVTLLRQGLMPRTGCSLQPLPAMPTRRVAREGLMGGRSPHEPKGSRPPPERSLGRDSFTAMHSADALNSQCVDIVRYTGDDGASAGERSGPAMTEGAEWQAKMQRVEKLNRASELWPMMRATAADCTTSW